MSAAVQDGLAAGSSAPERSALRFRIGGRVQGVGFRPFVYRLAQFHELTGWVRNHGGEVEILAEGPAERLRAFEDALLPRAPPAAEMCIRDSHGGAARTRERGLPMPGDHPRRQKAHRLRNLRYRVHTAQSHRLVHGVSRRRLRRVLQVSPRHGAGDRLMRILLLVHSFNSLSQRLYVELARDGHELSVELDIHDRVTSEAVQLFRPDLILAPFLKRAIPAALWQRHLCLIVHPGPPGDGGPSALDWAILRGVDRWGVTVLQAQAELDAGAVWASASFAMRTARKSSLYRHEVTEGAVRAVRAALERIAGGLGPLSARNQEPQHGWQPLLRQAQRAIDWTHDDSATVLRKIHSADGFPGVEDRLFDRCFRLFDAQPEMHLAGRPGVVIARRHGAVCRATRDLSLIHI